MVKISSGTAHFDEVQFLFSMRVYDLLNIERPKPGSISYKVMERMIELWVNFAKHGLVFYFLFYLLNIIARLLQNFEILNMKFLGDQRQRLQI